MRKTVVWVRVALVLLITLDRAKLDAQVLLSEIHYNPPEGAGAQFVEIHNTGPAEVDLSGWAFTRGILYVFPAGTRIAPDGYLAVGASRDGLLAAFPEAPVDRILGDFEGSLSNGGETISLSNSSSVEQDAVTYGELPPWDFLPDGYGPSLERICFSSPTDAPENWRASREGGAEHSGGTPGSVNGTILCPPAAPEQPRVFISEIMYHAVLEQAVEEAYEFVEIHNDGSVGVDLAGWRLAGGIDYAFPQAARIEPGQYLVIAKNPAKLAAVAGYNLVAGDLLGGYSRTLDNGGDRVALVGAQGQGIDAVNYDDDAPWPAGADALGAQEDWLAPELLPLENHRFRGISLERVSFDVPSSELANWVPSPLDGATPGRANAGARQVPLPVVAESLAGPVAGGDNLIREDQPVRVQVRFTPAAPAGAVELESFVDLIMTTGEEPISRAPMYDDGVNGGDLVAGDGVFTATLAGQPENTVVRYRILADRGAGSQRVSPLPSDPNAWNAYFVSPVIEANTRTYQILIHPTEWGKMWTGIQGGRVSGCNPSANWDRRYPAVLIHEGRVIDVLVRYQGSRYNRTNGRTIATWPYPKPTGGPAPLLALSWRIGLPRYSQLDGAGVLILNKLTQGCPGYNAGVGYKLFQEADLPGSNVRFVRLHVNGGYYHYMLELEHGDENLMRRYHRDQARKHPELPRESVGHLHKSAGCNCDEGPYGWGDERVLNAACGFTKEERYGATYDRQTHGWAGYGEILSMIEDLGAARRAGPDDVRQFFFDRFDVDLYMNYVAIMNWSVPFDDMFQNHFLYQRLSDGKWIVFPWDLDQNFGEWKQAQASIYMGEQGDPDNRSAWWNYVKDAFLKAFREEYDDRLLLLNNTILHPDHVAELVDQFTTTTNLEEARAAPAGLACGSFAGRAATFKQFAVQRFSIVNSKIAGVSLNPGASQTVFAGSTVQFDASLTKPTPSPDTPYTWSNGMTGDRPTFRYDEPGVHTVVLTVTVRGIPFQGEVTITVLPRPETAFLETGGTVVMEAESFTLNDRHGAEKSWWDADTVTPGYSGASYMEAKQTDRQTFLTKYAGIAPELLYAIRFSNPGTYRVWIRAFTTSTQADSVYVGLDGQERNARFAQEFQVDGNGFLWSGETRSEGPQTIEVGQPGLRPLSIWLRESGQIIDKIIVTRDQALVPEGVGPAETERGPTGGPSPFVRGDSDGDRRLSITDPIVLLRYLFQGGTILCADSGDADDNGKLDLTDAVRALDYLFRAGEPPPVPFPDSGQDPTQDELGCGN